MKGVLIAFVLLLSDAASARIINYTARNGDTPDSIAADYYGNRGLSIFIRETNGIGAASRILPGRRLRIPSAENYRVRRGETLEALALRFLGDRRRAPFLATFSNLKNGEKLREGQILVIPFLHVHRAAAPESLASLARAFYGDVGKAKLLAEFNGHRPPLLAQGEQLLIPVAHVRVRAVRLEEQRDNQIDASKNASRVQTAQKREDELAERVAVEIGKAETSYRNGDYAEVPAQLDRLLSAEEPSERQLVQIFQLKAFAYVALGLDPLARNAFREVLERDPGLLLSEQTTSPKIRASLERARRGN